MLKVRKISLANLSSAELDRASLRFVVGGKVCECTVTCSTSCGCKYVGKQQGPNDPIQWWL